MTIASDVSALAHSIVDPTALAAHTQSDRLRALSAAVLVLSHAEIETAIESACIATARLLLNSAEPHNAILVWGLMESNSSINVGKLYNKQSSALHKLVDDYEALVERNHGIKEHNLRTLLSPLGVDLAPLSTDVNTLDVFGATRGQLAHKPLSAWGTSALPSKHVNDAIQAGASADLVVQAIIAKHSLLKTPRPPRAFLRRRIAKALRWFGDAIE
ncbi:MAG: hypothetical protein SFU84_14610 [Gemmatimonadales bacterium]|nr:hypothetical protein [Gemmatimonadales bacterium]